MKEEENVFRENKECPDGELLISDRQTITVQRQQENG